MELAQPQSQKMLFAFRVTSRPMPINTSETTKANHRNQAGVGKSTSRFNRNAPTKMPVEIRFELLAFAIVLSPIDFRCAVMKPIGVVNQNCETIEWRSLSHPYLSISNRYAPARLCEIATQLLICRETVHVGTGTDFCGFRPVGQGISGSGTFASALPAIFRFQNLSKLRALYL